MAISKSTLSAIQKTGAVAHKLKLAVKAETKKYSDRLSKALSSDSEGNVFDLLEGPDIARWKGVGKLSKMIDAVEEQLVAAFKYASDLATGHQQKATKAPKAGKAKGKGKAAAAKKAESKAKGKAAAGRGASNPEKLLAYLNTVLDAERFKPMSQSAAAKATGIPLGSISAAVRKLVQTGDLVLGKDGGYQLSKKAAAPASEKAPVEKAAKAKAPRKAAAKKVAEKVAKAPAAKKAPAKRAVAKKTAAVEAPKVEAAPSEQVAAEAAPQATQDSAT